jgi:hypothetical protein
MQIFKIICVQKHFQNKDHVIVEDRCSKVRDMWQNAKVGGFPHLTPISETGGG